MCRLGQQLESQMPLAPYHFLKQGIDRVREGWAGVALGHIGPERRSMRGRAG